MEGIGSGVLGEIPFLLIWIWFHDREAEDAEIFFLILCSFACPTCPMKSLLPLFHRGEILVVFISSGWNSSQKRSEVYPVKPVFSLFNCGEFNWGLPREIHAMKCEAYLTGAWNEMFILWNLICIYFSGAKHISPGSIYSHQTSDLTPP